MELFSFFFAVFHRCNFVFKKILIANRGEIAVRLIRACRELKIKCVTVYSAVDKNALHVKLADEAYEVGPPDPMKSYLNMDKIIEVALKVNADAIHPGYGFLSENKDFAKKCEEEGISFIGPSPHVLGLAGDKSKAKEIAKKAGVPIIPGTEKPINTIKEAIRVSRRISYPVLIKPVDGGGGIGMRIARNEKELRRSFKDSQMESLKAFGSDRISIEKVIEGAKHIEMQIVADNYGDAVWLGERDCSIQRRYQKIIEEIPSPILSDEERKLLGEYALRIADAMNYNNVGTVEFLYKDGQFYLLEVNARLQVEHGITELVTGIDLVKEQIRLAYGEELKREQGDIKSNGWAIEARITAEDPINNFIPAPGKVLHYEEPGGIGVRVDSGIYQGYTIPPYYDSLVAKVMVWGSSRIEAVQRMKRSLSEFVIAGVRTTIPLIIKIVETWEFQNGVYDTTFLSNNLDRFKEELIEEEHKKIAALAALLTINPSFLLQQNRNPKIVPKNNGGYKHSGVEQSSNYVLHQIVKWSKKISPWRRSRFLLRSF